MRLPKRLVSCCAEIIGRCSRGPRRVIEPGDGVKQPPPREDPALLPAATKSPAPYAASLLLAILLAPPARAQQEPPATAAADTDGQAASSGAQATSSGAQAAPAPVDRAVAVVGDRVVTATEIEVAVVLAGRDANPVPMLAPGDRRLGEWWVEQVMLRELAGDIGVYQPEAGQVRERVERLVGAFDPMELAELEARLGMDRDGLVAWIQGRLVVERFVYRNVGLAAEAAGEDETQARARYEAWVAELRGTVAVRRIGPVQRR